MGGAVQVRAVRVGTEQEVPAAAGPRRRVVEDAPGEREGGGAADGLVGVRPGNDEDVAVGPARGAAGRGDGQHPERLSGPGGAGLAEPGLAGVFVRQSAGGEPEFLRCGVAHVTEESHKGCHARGARRLLLRGPRSSPNSG